METIEFTYCFKNEKDSTEIRTIKKEEHGLNCDDICEMFFDFMTAAGFSGDNILKYFNE